MRSVGRRFGCSHMLLHKNIVFSHCAPHKSKTKDPPVNGPGVFCFYLNFYKAKMDFSAK